MLFIQADANPWSAACWMVSRTRVRASGPLASGTDTPIRMVCLLLRAGRSARHRPAVLSCIRHRDLGGQARVVLDQLLVDRRAPPPAQLVNHSQNGRCHRLPPPPLLVAPARESTT